MASGCRLLPGLNIRPQKHFIGEKDSSEVFTVENKSMFVFLKNCENFSLGTKGKVGKIVCEKGKDVALNIQGSIIGGTLELINCEGVTITLMADTEVPIVTVDNSSGIKITLKKPTQLQSIYFHESQDIHVQLQLSTTPEILDENTKVFTLDTQKCFYDNRGEAVQWVAHWIKGSDPVCFITERVVRDGILVTTEEEKRAAYERRKKGLDNLEGMLSLCVEKAFSHRNSRNKNGNLAKVDAIPEEESAEENQSGQENPTEIKPVEAKSKEEQE